ncbi:MAG: antibiotic biosynthesis monooxygenase [Clostridia bacterium]|nr:antibiotic biosynthesis monooxygenase [Clostridia bacterium]
MIVLNVTYKCKPGLREEFLERILSEGIDEKSRAEEGNFKYDYYLSFEDNDELLLVEKWENDEALAAHGKQPHFLLLGELKPDYVTDMRVEKFILPE